MNKRQLRNKVITYLSNFGTTEEEKHNIKEKLKNICGKTGQYNVPDALYQKRTSRCNRALISWKTVEKNKLTLKQLESFSGGVVVEFINEDYFKNDSNPQSLFNILKNRLGSDEKVSSMISIRNESGTSSSHIERDAFDKLKALIPDYQNHLIKRKDGIACSGKGNDQWEGYIYYSMKGGQQNTILSHATAPFPQLFNPACDFANEEICLDIDLVLAYFAMFSIDKTAFNVIQKKEYYELLNEIKKELKNSKYDFGNLLEYCDNHPCLLLDSGKLFDPIQVEPINIIDFSINDKSNLNNLDLTHNEAVNKGKYYYDKTRGCVLAPTRPNNIFWSKHLSNMMQQNFSLNEYFEHEEKIVAKRKVKLNKN
ncbi:Uncharacterised protein [uncultured archaeon]|nr:Uncharacterised protein [uncultured archaeon]